MEHNKNNPKDEIDKLLYDYFKTHNEDVPIETSKAIDEALYKKKHKKHSSFKLSKIAAILILCFTMTTGLIFAKDIINFFNEIFNLKSTNIDNSGIVDAIANKNYIQNVDMDYIPIDDNYSIKVDYIMLDDLNLYLVFNLHSNKKVDENYRISIPDLVLTDQDGNVIYSGDNFSFNNNNNNILSCAGWNKIITEKQNMLRELLHLMTNGFTNLNKINISFTNFILYNENLTNENLQIEKNINFSIPIINKFFNENIYKFYSNKTYKDFEIKTCIANDSGIYLLYKTTNSNIDFNLENCTKNKRTIGYNTSDSSYYFIMHYNINKNIFKYEDSINITETTTHRIIQLHKLK